MSRKEIFALCFDPKQAVLGPPRPISLRNKRFFAVFDGMRLPGSSVRSAMFVANEPRK
jgi:hypothetical protein